MRYTCFCLVSLEDLRVWLCSDLAYYTAAGANSQTEIKQEEVEVGRVVDFVQSLPRRDRVLLYVIAC